jgi:hypothetical protein
MALTVAGKNYSQISGCESISDGGAWTGVDTQDSANYKEGSYSLCGTLKANGNNDAVFTPTAVVDMSGTKHLRCWYLCTSGGLLNTLAGGGIQIGISDGVNTGFWYLAGRDTYPGGWINLVVDVSCAVDSGTKPTSMGDITSITVRNNQTLGKNVDNVWIDNLCLCDGLIAYGDDGSGGYFDFDDIFSEDDTTLGIGIIRKIGGQYFATGSFEYGDSSGINACKFQAKSQILIFEDRPVNVNLYNLTIVDNGTGTTEFFLGSKSGTAGIEGCTIRVADVTQTPKFDVDASTDTDVDNFKIYGSTFLDADSISLPSNALTVEALNCNFESCGEILADTALLKYCNVISPNDRGLRLASASHNFSDSSLINCTHGIHVNLAGTFSFTNLSFTGCTDDIENSVNATQVDVYADTNQDTDVNLDGDPTAAGQTFTATAGTLSRGIFWMKKVGTPAGNMVAKLYATSAGAPTGAALATSEVLSADSLAVTYGWASFEFHDEYTLVASTVYAIVVEYTGTATDYAVLGVDNSTPGHGGTGYHYSGSWSSQTWDVCFSVNSGGIVKINATNSNPSTSDNTGTPEGIVIIVNSVTMQVKVIDEDRDPIQDVQTSIRLLNSPYTELMNEDTLVTGIASEGYNYLGDVDVVIKARKSDDLDSPRYQAFSAVDKVTSDGLALIVTLKVNPVLE